MTYQPTRTVYRVTALFDAPDPTCQRMAWLVALRLSSTPADDVDAGEKALISTIRFLATVCKTTCSKLIPGHLVATPLAYYDSWRHGPDGLPPTEQMHPGDAEVLRMRMMLAAIDKKGPCNGSPAR